MEVSGQLHAPAALPQGKEPGTHWIGGCVGPRASLDTVVKGKIMNNTTSTKTEIKFTNKLTHKSKCMYQRTKGLGFEE
jgi:hypothetical protein